MLSVLPPLSRLRLRAVVDLVEDNVVEVDSPLLMLAVIRFGRLTMEDDDETLDAVVVVIAVVRGMLSIDDCEDAKNKQTINVFNL